MCMVGRKILIQGEARKNKGRRKKYFLLNIGPNYATPRLDYYASIDKWHRHKDDLTGDTNINRSSGSIELSNLFFVDNSYRSKPKHGGLDLYMEDRHLMLRFSSNEVRNQWKDILDNVIYKNGKTKSYPQIEHTLQVGIRVKPKESIDKAVLLQYNGNFRACFTKTSLMFVNKSLDNPNFSVEYQFIRNLESRFDGTFRLEIGRAALIGESHLILQLADYDESKAAHTMLINCSKFLKVPTPEPPRLRRHADKSSMNMSNSRLSTLTRGTSSCGPNRSNSCIAFSGDSSADVTPRSKLKVKAPLLESEDYMTMNATSESDSVSAHNYIEHVSRFYKCVVCSQFTKIITFCSRCTSASSLYSLHNLPLPKPSSNDVFTKLPSSLHPKTQSLSTQSRNPWCSLRTAKSKQSSCEPQKSLVTLINDRSSANTSTYHLSPAGSINSNRHDNDLFVELNFEHHRPATVASHFSTNRLKCGHCSASLVHTDVTSSSYQRCTKCSDGLVSVAVVITDSVPRTDTVTPRSAGLVPNIPMNTGNSEYVEVCCQHINQQSHLLDNFCH